MGPVATARGYSAVSPSGSAAEAHKAAADSDGFVHPLGIPVLAGSLFPYTVSIAALLQVLLLPIVGAISDYAERKKQILAFSASAN